MLAASCVRPANAPQQAGSLADMVAARCHEVETDERWLRDALSNWQAFAREQLQLADPLLPRIVSFNAHCAYDQPAGQHPVPVITVVAHDGQVTLPNGSRIPAGPNAFNAMTDAGNFLAMSLPSVWRAVGLDSEIGLELFLEGVMFHELSHFYHAQFLGPSRYFPGIQQLHGFPEGLNDDSVQDHFHADPDYVRAWQAETETFFRAAAAATDAEARALACEGLAMMRERRRRWFAGPDARWAIVDEISLTTEGVGQWSSFAWLTGGRGLAPERVLPRLRGTFWSQEEGLAIFLVVDRLAGNWQSRVFTSPSETAEPLLARACGR